MTTASELRAWLDQGDVQACEHALGLLASAPTVGLDLDAWSDTALHALQLGQPGVAKQMGAYFQAHPTHFAHDEDAYLYMTESIELIALDAEIPRAHQQAIAAYMLGHDAPLSALLKHDAKACVATHAVLLRRAPRIAAFFVPPAHSGAHARLDRMYLVLGVGGVVLALMILAGLARYGSSWAGPSVEPFVERSHASVTPDMLPTEPPHPSDAALALRIALLRARPCVCEHALAACTAITLFDRSPTPSCVLLEHAALHDALLTCSNDEAREVLSQACPDLR